MSREGTSRKRAPGRASASGSKGAGSGGSGRGGRLLGALGGISALGVAIAMVSSIGGPQPPGVGLIVTVERAVVSGGPAAAYLLAAFGLGGLAAPLWRGAREEAALRLGVGLGLMLSVTFVLGMAGLLNAATGLGVLGLGLVAGVISAARSGAGLRPAGARLRVSPWLVLWIVPVAVLVTAAANPPEWLWDSEFGGYDVLSYHLQLPQEWLAAGRIRTYEHNVYSFLPGYVEAAFFHLAVATGAPRPGGEAWPGGLLAGGGWRAHSAQYLHVLLTLVAAWLARRATLRALALTGRDDDVAPPARAARARDAAGWLAGALLLATPWIVVVGSIAYNEMAVVALGLAALLAAMETGVRAPVRGALVGGLVGAACGAKPTALLFVGLPMGVALAGIVRGPRAVAAACGAGALTGAVALAPWLARNGLASGNPVFPHLSGVFGTGHWTAEQVERYRGAHFFDGSLAERLELLVVPVGEAARGVTHTQWGVLFGLIGLALVGTLVCARPRRIGAILGLGLGVQILAWLLATHLQSRFLIPLMIVGVPLAGLIACSQRVWRAWVGAGLLAGVVLVQSGLLLVVFGSQQPNEEGRGQPNHLLVPGTRWYTGELDRTLIESAGTSRQRARLVDRLGPTQLVNVMLPPDAAVHLLGGATPFYYRPPVVYHTTWDASPLGAAIEGAPGEPAAWTAALRERGIDFVLVDQGELRRLVGEDGWYDPRVTLERVERWARELGSPDRRWDGGRIMLFDLRAREVGTGDG